jgi:hypothetical protein
LALVKFSKKLPAAVDTIRLGLLGVKLRLDGLADALGDGRQIVVAARLCRPCRRHSGLKRRHGRRQRRPMHGHGGNTVIGLRQRL